MSDNNNYIGLYLHIPFCKTKCPYCDFFSGRAKEQDFDNYTDVLIQKINMWSQKTDKAVSTIYIGGGTPSILGAVRLCRILDAVRSDFRVCQDAEITVEVNPDSGKELDFLLLAKSGVNRISVGLQSAVESELKALGRIHTAEEARLTVLRANEAGITNTSLDLMMGIPDQTKESLLTSIDFCASCGVNHISSYILKLEEGTVFDRISSRLNLPDEDTQAELYFSAIQRLEELGYRQYEISNFAKEGFESRHNSSYWKCREYIGIGASAHSFFEGKRFYYPRSLDDFSNDVIIQDGYGGDEEEYIMLSLRLREGISYSEYESRYRKTFPDEITNKAKKYIDSGFIRNTEDGFALTAKGYLVSNSIISDLLY